jgi:hypothetical protein
MATASMPAPEAQSQPAISPMGRIIGVYFSPKATFEDIVRKPSWVLPVVLLTLFSIGVSFAINQRINWREFISQQMEKSPQAANMSAEQKEQRIEGGAKFSAPFTYAIGLLGPIIGILVVALVMWGAYNLLGGANTNFGTSFAITAHAFLTGLLSSILFYSRSLFEAVWQRRSREPRCDQSCRGFAGRFREVARGAAEIDRCFHDLDTDLAGHRLRSHQSKKVAGEQGVHHRVFGLGSLCSVSSRLGVYLLLIHSMGELFV